MAHSDGSNDLTVREYLVLTAVAAGLSVREVAAELGDSPEAVSRSLASATDKLGAVSEPEAVAIALRAGLIAVPRPLRRADDLDAS